MLEITGLEGTYERIRADKPILADTVSGLREGVWDGLNVTVPLKIEAAAMADRLSPRTQFSRSINTILLHDGVVYGESTDSVTFEDLLRTGPVSDIDEILVLGSGGSAAAALAAIGDGRRVSVSARRVERAVSLAEHFGCDVAPWGSNLPGALVINATTLGMNGETLPDGVVDSAGGVIDLPYGEAPTPTVESAAELGIPYVDGPEFLIRQAIASFHLWTGETVEFGTLSARLRNA